MSKLNWDKDKKRRLSKQKVSLGTLGKDKAEEFVGVNYVLTDMDGKPLPLNPPLHKLGIYPRPIRLVILKLNSVRSLIKQVRSPEFLRTPPEQQREIIIQLLKTNAELFDLDLDVIRGYVLGKEYRQARRIADEYEVLLRKNDDIHGLLR